MSFFCISCKSNIDPEYRACPYCGEPITDFLRNYLEKPIDGKYKIISRLGAGGMGDVYKVLHVHLNAVRVIKLMRSQISDQEGAHERFIREARLAERIQSPYVAALYDFSTMADGSYYMVWEYIEGTNLLEVIRSRGSLSQKYAAQVAYQALLGLDAIHRVDVVHRDISPENLMITRDEEGKERVKIIDLGIAKQWGEGLDEKTKTGIFVGKWKYCSPEHLGMLKEGERIDGRADLYSFGIVLYEMLSGVAPFIADTPHRYLVLHAAENPRPISEVSPNTRVSPEFEALVFKALEKDRNKRFSSAREFARALEAIMPDLPDDPIAPTLAVSMPESVDDEMTHMQTRAIPSDKTMQATQRSMVRPAPDQETPAPREVTVRASAPAPGVPPPAATPPPSPMPQARAPMPAPLPGTSTVRPDIGDAITGELPAMQAPSPAIADKDTAETPIPVAPPAMRTLAREGRPVGASPLDRELTERALEDAAKDGRAVSLDRTLMGEPMAPGEAQSAGDRRQISSLDQTLMSEKIGKIATPSALANASSTSGTAPDPSKPAALEMQIAQPAQRPVSHVSRPAESRGGKGLMIAVAAIALIAAAALFVLKPWEKAPASEVVVEAPSGEAGGGSPSGTQFARLGLNAYPWGEVVSIRNIEAGRLVEVEENLQTPAGVDLVAGRYEITMRHPKFGTKSEVVELTAGSAATVTITFTDASESLPFKGGRR